MSEKKEKMKFKIGAKMTGNKPGECEVIIALDCPPTFIIANIARLLVDKQGETIAPLILEAVQIAEIARMSSDPSAMVDRLVAIKAGLCAGAEGDTDSGLKGLIGMLSLLDEVIKDAPKGSEE